jgi:acyl-CoA thioester hydrolase
MSAVYQHHVRVTPNLVDRNGHVNNVAYIQWMQDAAVAHARASGCTAATDASGATWVVRTHRIEYLRPLLAGDVVTVTTWVANFRKVRSLRQYRFVRVSDQATVAEAETDWVFVDAATGRPRAIPESIQQILPAQAPDPAP